MSPRTFPSFLGIQNTLKYLQLVHFKDDESDVATARTSEEVKELLAEGSKDSEV